MTGSKRVLIVDDDHDIRRGAHFRLRAAGYETLQASDGREGVESAAGALPDVIVMDVRMPGMSGVEAIEQLRAQPHTRSIPVIVVSASPSEESAALEQGARYFLRKPYSADALVAAVNAVSSASPGGDPAALLTSVTPVTRKTPVTGPTDPQSATIQQSARRNRPAPPKHLTRVPQRRPNVEM